jgi:hypothetical protein
MNLAIMYRFLAVLSLALVIFLSSFAQARKAKVRSNNGLPPPPTDRLIVRFKPAVAISQSTHDSLGIAQQSDLTQGIKTFTVKDGKSVVDKVNELKGSPLVDFVEPDYLVKLDATTVNDPFFKDLWGMRKANFPEAWDYTKGDRKVKVCVIDSGSQKNHVDLVGNIAAGYNTVPKGSRQGAPISRSEWGDNDGHGTHVAGTIAAVGNNGKGVVGGSWLASMYICRFIGDLGYGYISDAITCIQWCRGKGTEIYSNSWGGVPYSAALDEEIKKVQTAGGLFVVAAGNNGQNIDVNELFPGAYRHQALLSVAATTENDRLAPFSNYGSSRVHLGAPGTNILSTTINNGYNLRSGTSMACPITSAAAVLIKAIGKKNNFNFTPAMIKDVLMSTVDKNPHITTVSGGRLNAGRAVKAALRMIPPTPSPPPPRPPPPTPPVPGSSRPIGGRILVPPTCGTSLLKKAPARQSSNWQVDGDVLRAGRAVNGNCRTHVRVNRGACSATSPSQSNPWWTATMPSRARVYAVSITPRSDCCWSDLGNAQIFVGDSVWTGPQDRRKFTLCATVRSVGIAAGRRATYTCTATSGVVGTNIAIFLPAKKKTLALCEVDVTAEPVVTKKLRKK